MVGLYHLHMFPVISKRIADIFPTSATHLEISALSCNLPSNFSVFRICNDRLGCSHWRGYQINKQPKS